ncbi:hypothetical protein HCN44_006958 [Aphidius gifuensis]|uniref:chymotrypsin n=1 Tax=Aphidius gifuensis TaxID=684658 RepID=A0A834Y3L4_APHGI|nr:trypsin-like [Aphidius gifuensis]KAF7995851.1 hypothetical protein HCN44_006958 [Aphidius gifuensis]
MSSKLIIILGIFLAVAEARYAPESSKPYLGYSNTKFDITKIVGGSEAVKNNYPHQVSLQWGTPPLTQVSHFCGGSIISERWILTAGHCVLAVPDYGSFIVKAGKHVLNEQENEEQSIEVEASFIHESYSGGVAPYDVAILKLKVSLVINQWVSPIKLPKQGILHNGDAVLTGWGSIVPSGTTLPSNLQTAVFPIIDLDTCRSSLEQIVGPSPLHETNICTGPLTGGYSACSGDSGGPLISRQPQQDDEIIGIVSWGIIPCGTLGAPSVFTRVSAFVEWIEIKIASN